MSMHIRTGPAYPNSPNLNGPNKILETLFPYADNLNLKKLLEASSLNHPTLKEKFNFLINNNVKIILSRTTQINIEDITSQMLTETPMPLKYVLSHENQQNKPSLLIKQAEQTEAENNTVEIISSFNQTDADFEKDLVFAIDFMCEWKKNQKWPTIYAYYKMPKPLSSDLISTIAAMSIELLKSRNDICDLSTIGFKAYHGEKANQQVTGRVITIKVPQGDNKPVANAFETQTSPGDIVVIDGGGASPTVTLGGITAALAQKVRGIAGILIYGQVRDQDELKNLSIPVFALNYSSSGPTKVGPGAVHCMLNLGNVPFQSGDIIKIDGNNIVVIPLNIAESNLAMNTTTKANDISDVSSQRQLQITPKTFVSLSKKTPKNRPRPQTPKFISQLFQEFTPAQICDTASFIHANHLWGSGPDLQLITGALNTTLVGTAIITNGFQETILSNLDQANKGDFLVIDESVTLNATIIEKINQKEIACIVVNGKAIIQEGAVCRIPCFSRNIDIKSGLMNDRTEFSHGFKIKQGYIVMADIDGIAAFSPSKFEVLYRAGFKKNVQEQQAEAKNKNGHPHPLPSGSIITHRYFPAFVDRHIEQYPFLEKTRGWANMKLPETPKAIVIKQNGMPIELGLKKTIEGLPTQINTHGEEPISFTLKDKENTLEITGLSGLELFKVALAIENKTAITIKEDGSIL